MRRGNSLAVQLVGAVAVGAVAGTVFFHLPQSAAVSAALSGCAIKGNISITSGERIYHLPGQQYYDETIITPEKGERWFCTEAEAQAAGWRRAGK